MGRGNSSAIWDFLICVLLLAVFNWVAKHIAQESGDSFRAMVLWALGLILVFQYLTIRAILLKKCECE